MFHEATPVVGLDFQGSGEHLTLSLLLLPVAMHVVEDEFDIVSMLDFLS